MQSINLLLQARSVELAMIRTAELRVTLLLRIEQRNMRQKVFNIIYFLRIYYLFLCICYVYGILLNAVSVDSIFFHLFIYHHKYFQSDLANFSSKFIDFFLFFLFHFFIFVFLLFSILLFVLFYFILFFFIFFHFYFFPF